MAKSRLDLGHGFVKSIIRNQVDRDNYDKEIKSSSDKPKQRPFKKKERRPDIITYVLPKDRNKQVAINCSNDTNNKSDNIDDTINSKTSGDCCRDDGLTKVTKDFRKKLNF